MSLAAMPADSTRVEPVAPDQPARGRRSVQLDILRGVAVLLVLGRHTPIGGPDAGIWRPLADAWNRFGWTGVDLFFVLSGFLIGGLLFDEVRKNHRLDAGRFLIRRGLKIYPSYFFFMIGVTALTRYRRGIPWDQLRVPGELRTLVVNTLSLQNYLGSPWPHTWSLAVEEHFYLLLPFVLLVLLAISRDVDGRIPAVRLLPPLALILIVTCTGLRWRAERMGYATWSLVTQTHLRIDALFFGVLLAYLARYRRDLMDIAARWRRTLLVAGLILISPMVFLDQEFRPFVPTFGLTLLYLGYGCILLALIQTPLDQGWAGRLLASRLAAAVAFLGMYSYTTYLWHLDLARDPILWLIGRGVFRPLPSGLQYPVVMALFTAWAAAVGFATAWLVERPTLHLRNKLFPSRA